MRVTYYEFSLYLFGKYRSALILVGPIRSACNAQGQRMHYAQTNSSCSLLSTDLQVGPVADARER